MSSWSYELVNDTTETTAENTHTVTAQFYVSNVYTINQIHPWAEESKALSLLVFLGNTSFLQSELSPEPFS